MAAPCETLARYHVTEVRNPASRFCQTQRLLAPKVNVIGNFAQALVRVVCGRVPPMSDNGQWGEGWTLHLSH